MSEGNEKVTKKVILLYIADRLAALTQDEFMEIAIDTIYMDYFEFSHIYEQLLHDGFLDQATLQGETNLDANGVPAKRVDITESGKQILNSLYSSVPLPIRNHLRQSTDTSLKIRSNLETVKATYALNMSGTYRVHLQLKDDEQSSLLDLSFSLPNQAMAVQASENWENHYAELYPKLLSLLASRSNTGDGE